MPWDPQSFKSKHNHGASPAQAEQGAAIANSVLEKTRDEGKALRIANGVIKKRRYGGAKDKDHSYGR